MAVFGGGAKQEGCGLWDVESLRAPRLITEKSMSPQQSLLWEQRSALSKTLGQSSKYEPEDPDLETKTTVLELHVSMIK